MNTSQQPRFYPVEALVEHLAAGHTIVTPNDRLARRIKQGWAHQQAQAGSSAWASPSVMSLQQWWQHCYDTVSLGGEVLPALATLQQELEIWHQVIESDPDCALLLRPRGAAKLAREAWHSLLLWRQDWRQAPLAQEFRFDADATMFLNWASEFESRLASRQLVTLPQLLPELAAQHRTSTIVLAEFDELAPLYDYCLQQQAASIETVHAGQQRANCQLVACDDNGAELASAALWAAQQHRESPEQRIGILLPNLQQQRFTMERSLREAFALPALQPAGVDSATRLLPVNFSAGVALASCGPVRAALGLLGLMLPDQQVPDLVNLLHSRYRHNHEVEHEQVLISRLFARGREKISTARLRRECARVDVGDSAGLALGSALSELIQAQSMKQLRPCSQWRPVMEHVLSQLGWPGTGTLDSLEFQQVEQWHRVMEQLREFDAVSEPMAFNAALQRLTVLCENAVFQPQTADASVQVLGLLEAAGLEFDALWLCGFGASNWPPAPEPNPFIPGRIQKALAMPHASSERELHYARGLLAQFQRSATTIIASYSRQEDDVEQRASALVIDYTPWVLEAVPPDTPAEWIQLQQKAQRCWFSDDQAPVLGAEQAAQLGGGSNLIADQSQCPFRAFARHRLGARPLPELGSGLSAAERGTLLHDSLFRLWEQLSSSEVLQSLSEAQRATAIADSVNTAIEAFRIHDSEALGRSLLEVERQRLQQLLQQWLVVEAQREPFVVHALEQKVELNLGLLQLKLRIDRVDRQPDGRELVIDYKSGNNSKIKEWLGERPEGPQLPLYALMPETPVAGVAFAVINRRSVELRGLAEEGLVTGLKTDIERESKGEVSDWPAMLAHWQRVLTQLAQDFVDGKAAVDPLDKSRTCSYCGLESLCRVE